MRVPEHPYTPREATVCRLWADLPAAWSCLNVGMKRPSDPRNLWWLKLCWANGVEPFVLEAFARHCQELREFGLPHVIQGDVQTLPAHCPRRFDVALWWHGPEHLPTDAAERAIDGLWQQTRRLLILGCPRGHEPQDECEGNAYERHQSAWEPEQLAALGFQTQVVVDHQPYPHLTAWRWRETSLA